MKNNMEEFTAENARNITSTESYSIKGCIIDKIRSAAKNNQHSVTIKNLRLDPNDKAQLKMNGFSIINNTISWKE